jgi:NAD(P)-dependent dehydrogenase (short-subunit alcohol dehydrogenase family)
MKRMDGKVALVTGAAMGIGRACAELLAAEGAAVIVTDLETALGTAVADAIQSGGGRAAFFAHDVTNEAQWIRVVGEARRAFGKLDVLVNNAGVGRAGDVEHETLQGWRDLLAVNLDGVFLGIKHAIQPMREAGGGSIVNLSSIEGLVGDPSLAAYNASKGGVRLLTKSAALYCAKNGTRIRVNSVHPGYIWTPMVQHFTEASGHAEELRRSLEQLHPVGHLGEASDVAYGVLYLASDESKFVTGAELVIDGGYTAQ